MKHIFLLLALCVSSKFMVAQDPEFSIKTPNLFSPLTDGLGYHNYRIPSLLSTSDGTLLAIMEGRVGMNHDHAQNDIVLRRSTDNGITWEEPQVIIEAGRNVVMNPVVTEAQDGSIVLMYIYFPEKRHTGKRSHGVTRVDVGNKGTGVERLFVVRSFDKGATWQTPKEITKVAKSEKNTIYSICGPGVGVTLCNGKHKGRMVVPMSESFLIENKNVGRNFVLYSDNNGKTWKHSKLFPVSEEGDTGGNEIQVVELDGGRVLASVRSKGCRLLSTSDDGGKTWSPLYKEKTLVDTGCMSPLLRYETDDAGAVLFHVSVTDRIDGRRRGRAVIYASYDDGASWVPKRVIHDKCFDYCSLVRLSDGSVGMLAEYNFDGERADIHFAKFNRAWIEEEVSPITLRSSVERPKNYFRTHPNHTIPSDMVIQKFKVNLFANFIGGNNETTFQFRLIQKQGDAKLLNSENTNQFSPSNTNTFLADWYGSNVIEVTAKDKKGVILGVVTDTIFVEFSHSQLTKGDYRNLDTKYTGKEYIAGKIANDTLVYQGMRFLPSDISKGDLRYEGTKFGAYETKEPRVLALKDGTLVATYHFQVKGKNDAPPGLTVVVTRSVDGGKIWINDQILMQSIDGVVGYTSLVEYNNEVQCYFTGGHTSHQQADAFKGVYRTVSKDKGKTWSTPESMTSINTLVTDNKVDFISPTQSLNTNALFVPQMTWKGKTGDAILLPFYIDPVHFIVSLDGGTTWDVFYDAENYPEMKNALNEISWCLLNNRQIYVVSRRQSKSGYKNEMLFNLDGTFEFLGQDRKNHKARRCHQGAVVVPEGSYKGRVAVASNLSGDREEATIAISSSSDAKSFDTRYLTTNSAWGYCHIEWNKKLHGFVLIGESEPFDENENSVSMDNGPDRNERFNIECFAFSPAFYQTLEKANIDN